MAVGPAQAARGRVCARAAREDGNQDFRRVLLMFRRDSSAKKRVFGFRVLCNS